ncbi:GAF domain-containing protein [Streptomyces sp. NPDC005483]|uniref:GAF domain-containing protein n=1 Tax=Streptomyces sp. NPDC005483 TaxID=3154882 RepID=UPI0033BCE71C
MRPAPWSERIPEIARTLGLPTAGTPALDEPTNVWLRGLLNRHEAVAGTVHVVRDNLLHIAAAHNIPPKVQQITARIPVGKGMAGLAWQQDRPIQTCNLKDDDSGAVKPGAKAVDGKAAVALPVRGANGTVRAVVGLAWLDERELTGSELAKLGADAAELPGTYGSLPRPRRSHD